MQKYHHPGNTYSNLITSPQAQSRNGSQNQYKKDKELTSNSSVQYFDSNQQAQYKTSGGLKGEAKKNEHQKKLSNNFKVGSFAEVDEGNALEVQNQKEDQMSTANFMPSMTPIFTQLSPETRRSPPYRSQRSNQEKSKSATHQSSSSKDQLGAAEMLVNQQHQYLRSLKPLRNIDIFETMEKEMKQIMDLFAKERKSRKKEMTKLKE